MRRRQRSFRERWNLTVVLVSRVVRLWVGDPARLLDVGILNCRRTAALQITAWHSFHACLKLLSPIWIGFLFSRFLQVPILCGNSRGCRWEPAAGLHVDTKQSNCALISRLLQRLLPVSSHTLFYTDRRTSSYYSQRMLALSAAPAEPTATYRNETERAEIYGKHFYFLWFMLLFSSIYSVFSTRFKHFFGQYFRMNK